MVYFIEIIKDLSTMVKLDEDTYFRGKKMKIWKIH